MNNNMYGNNKITTLSDAYLKLAQARAIRDASVNNQQIDSSGVVLNTAPQSNNNVQAQEEQQVPQTTTTTYDASVGERVLGTVYEAINNIKSGLLNTVEGVVDYAISGIGGLINEEWAEEAVKFDVTDTLLQSTGTEIIYKQLTGQNLVDQSYLYEADEKVRDIVIGVEQGIGNALAFLGLSSVPFAGKILVGMGAGGMAVEEALIDGDYGGNYWGAFAYGTASGIVETAIEYLSMGTGQLLSKFGLDNAMGAFAGHLTKNTTSREALTTIIGSFASEGLEEVASDLVNPLLSSLYNGKSVEENYQSDVTAEGLGTTFLVGGLTGALMSGGGKVVSDMYLSPEGSAIASEINANTDKYAEAYKAFKEATQTADITTQQNALKEFNKVRDEVVASMEALGTRIKNLASEYQYRLGTTTVIDGKKVKLPLTSEVISGQAETMKNFSPVEQAVVEVLDVVNKQRNNNGLENLEVEFSSDVDYNGMISGNKLVLSTNPQKAIRQVLSHEITHSFENNSEYQGVYDEIINTLKKNGEYEQAYKDMEALYKKNNVSYNNELLNKELVAEYVANNLFSSYADMSKAFSKQSTLNKFVDMLKGLRKKSSSSKAKDLYLKMIQKGMSSKVNETKKYSLKPTTNEDSNGNKLSKEQLEYFKDTKIVDEYGNLLVVYHGTSNAGFTVFDARDGYGNYRFGNHIVNFATSDKRMGSSYTRNPKSAKSFDPYSKGITLSRLKEFVWAVGNEMGQRVDILTGKELNRLRNSNVVSNLNEYYIVYDNGYSYFGSYKDIVSLSNQGIKDFLDTFGDPEEDIIDKYKDILEKGDVYELYLDIKNPLIVDAKGAWWNRINYQDEKLKNEKEAISKLKLLFGEMSLETDVKENAKNFVKLAKKVGLEARYSLEDEFFIEADFLVLRITINGAEDVMYAHYTDLATPEDFYKQVASYLDIALTRTLRQTTNDIVQKAINNGSYDGVIIKNVIDYGNLDLEETRTPNDIYITIKSSNQLKSIYNKKPTKNDDIRYSLKESIIPPVLLGVNIDKENVHFVDSYKDTLQAVQTLSTFRGKMDVNYRKNIKTLANELVNSMRINGLTLDKYFEMDAKSEDYKDFIKSFKSQMVTYIMSETYNLLKDEKQVVVNDMIQSLIGRVYDTIDTYKKLNARGRKVTAKISALQYWFKNAIAQGKKYSKEKLESLLENVAKKISGIKFTSITTRTQAGARNVVVELQGETFFKNEKVEPFLNKDEGVRMYIDEAIKYIVERAKTEGVKPLDTDTVINDSNYGLLAGKTEAEVVADILSEVRRIVNASNEKVGYLDGELVNVKEKAQEEATEQRKIDRKTPAHKVLGYPNQYFLSLVDIRTYMVVMAHSNNNSLMMKLYNQLEQGQRKTFEIRTKLLKDLTQYLKDNSKSIRKLKSKKDSITFGGVKMTIGEAISLYMMSKTDNAWSHLVKDGVKFRTEVEGKPRDITGDVFLSYLSEEEQNLLKDKSFLKSRKESNLERKNELYLKAIESARNELKSLIGTEYDGLIKTIEDIYSNSKSGKYYEEASKKILGYSFGLKKYYYPTRSATLDLKEETELVSHIQTQFNPSFTKQVVKGASNDLFVSDVVDTALAFVKNLSTFAGVTVEINNAKRFLNAQVKVSGLNKSISLYEYFNDMVDNRFKQRIDALFQAMQGLKTKIDTPLDKATKWARGMGAKMALGANLKTMLTQLTSYIRGSMYISNSNLIRALGNPKSFGLLDFSVAEEESPIIANRYFDNNVLNIESINAFNQVDKMTELFMKPIEVFDKIPIKRLWYACQLQTMENGKVNKEKALELYERVVRDTQAQYDALGNGSITRVENEFVKSLLMYTSESRKMFSRFYEAIYRVATSPKGSTEYNQAKKLLASAGTNIIANAVIVTMISVIFKQLKGDYDDKEKEEILADIIKQDFASQIIGMFPFISNIYNTLANGYELQLGGLSQVTQLMDIFTTHLAVLSNPNSSKGEMRSALIQIVQKIGHFFGIPVRNLFNDTLYIAGLGDLFLDTDMVLKMKNFWYNTNNSSLSTLLSTYKSKGNVDKVEAVIEMKFKNYGAGELGKEDVSEISRLYMSGALKSLPKQLGETMTFNNETMTLSKQQTKIAKDVYSIANDLLSKMIRSSAYSSLSDEEKALAIRRLYDTYYELAKGSVIKEYELNKLASVADYIDMSKYAVYLAKIASMTENKTQTRKVVVQSYINSLRLNKNEKYLLNYLAGYKLSKENQAFVANYLRSQGMAYTEARNYFA